MIIIAIIVIIIIIIIISIIIIIIIIILFGWGRQARYQVLGALSPVWLVQNTYSFYPTILLPSRP